MLTKQESFSSNNKNLTTSNILSSFSALQNHKNNQKYTGNEAELDFCNKSSKPQPGSKRNFKKVSKFKEITRLCLYQTQTNSQNRSFIPASTETQVNKASSQNQSRSKEHLIEFLIRDFLTDCRQRLDFDSFKKLLLLLHSNLSRQTEQISEFDFDQNLSSLNEAYQIIKSDFNLCNKFSAFLTSETALHFGLFTQHCQYEKSHEFMQKLEICVPNKCTFKKLIQSIVTSCNSTYEHETGTDKIEEIKAKIKAVVKNNALIDIELDYLFDQRLANLEPAYEKISLIDVPIDENINEVKGTSININENKRSESYIDFLEKRPFYEEHIDLTNGLEDQSQKNQSIEVKKNVSKIKKKLIPKQKGETKKRDAKVVYLIMKKHT